MALNFPTSPSYGDTYGQYVYDGAWQLDRPSSDKTPTIAVVSGASVTPTYDGTAAVYSFTSDGNIIIESAGYADILLVGGGGAGAAGCAGGSGGGAGGYLYIENAYLPAGSLDVVVGAGGEIGPYSASLSTGRDGNNGYASSLHKYFAPGGAGGRAGDFWINTNGVAGMPGHNGASGSGASGWVNGSLSNVGGAGVTGLGNNGGTANNRGGGGGGGASAVGANSPAANQGGDGGAGASNSITGSAVTYAGGGGGGGNTVAGTGGAGGGSNGATGNNNATDATSNTGGGGGGSYATGTTAGAGGSGIVIVRINS